jgi:hypothetical protein
MCYSAWADGGTTHAEPVRDSHHLLPGERRKSPVPDARARAEDVELEMVVKTDANSFPESAKGLGAVEDILGRRFANDFENVYTFCLQRPSAGNRRHFPCQWLVGMSAKNNGPIRVGSGCYNWYFTPDERCLVERLVITIDVMQIFPQPSSTPS